jgi:hypothetical protein
MTVRDTRNTIARQKAVRQEALRQQLSSGKHLEHVIEMVKKVTDETNEIEPAMVQRYKIGIDAKLSLVKKYMPDLKQIETSETDDMDDMTIDELEQRIKELL